MRARRPSPEERRKIFRRMEWVFVYGPPLLLAFVAIFAAAFLAFVVPVPGTGYWGRWGLALLLILGLPLLAYGVRAWWRKR